MLKKIHMFFLIYPITLLTGLAPFLDASPQMRCGVGVSNPLITTTCKEHGCDKSLKIKLQDDYGRMPLSFIQNDGQLDEKVKFYEKGIGRVIFFTERGVYLSLVNSLNSQNPKSELVKLIPLATSKTSKIIADGLLEGKVNYFTGNNSEKWKTNIATYQSVVYKDIYKGIDMKFYGNNRQMEYDIIVKPGANPSRVQLSYQGIKDLRVTGEGDLEICLKEGNIIQKKPYVYQEIDGKRVEVAGKFKIQNLKYKVQNTNSETRNRKSKIRNPKFIYGFQVASYNKNYPLIIDPVLVYSTYLGGNVDDTGYGIAVDTTGNAYVVGCTSSTDFPTASPLYGSLVENYDVFVTKLNATGNGLIYSTYLGGSGEDKGLAIVIDLSGNAYITGYTRSGNFPMASALYGIKPGGYDAFVAKLNPSGNGLIYSTYLGGGFYEEGRGIALDTAGNVYVTGTTASPNFPTASAIYGTLAGDYDAFATKINASGNGLVYSTYLGGSWHDEGRAIAVDTSGNVYVTGEAYSNNFPTTSAAYSKYKTGDLWHADVFITKINSSGNSLAYSTYLGGTHSDYGYGIAADTSGNAYVTGYTVSADFPTASALYATSAGDIDAFVTKINPSGSGLVYSTYLGGSSTDAGRGIVVDTTGNVYVAGWTGSPNFPAVSVIDNFAGGDAFVTKINASGNSLIYSTCFGGSKLDSGYGIAIDTAENVYFTGETVSDDLPTLSAFDISYAGGSFYDEMQRMDVASRDAFVAKIAPSGTTTTPTPTPIPSPSPSPTVTTGLATNVTSDAVTLNGTVNANGLPTTAWFEYGTASGVYNVATSSQSLGGSIDTAVSINISGLLYDTPYYYRIVAQNSAGTSYGKELSFTPTSVSDTTPPTVSSTNPTNGATGIAVNTSITVTFSEEMDASTITPYTFVLTSGVTGTVTCDGNTATFTPSSNLSYSTTYSATITNGVMDLSGNVMITNYTWSFTTAAASTVKVTSIVVSPTELKLAKKTSKVVTVTVTGENGVPVKGVTVTATIDPNGKNFVSVTPTSKVTDDKGQATFTITAMSTIAETKINFQASGLNKVAIVAVKIL